MRAHSAISRPHGGRLARLVAATLGTMVIVSASLIVDVARAPSAAAGTVVPFGCTTDTSALNTGRNPVSGLALPNGSIEPVWDVAIGATPATFTSFLNFTPAASLADAGTWTSPVVNKLAGPWVDSPYSNANWIGLSGIPNSRFIYYRVQFDLAAGVDPGSFSLTMSGSADDYLADVFVNGTSYVAEGKQSQLHPTAFNALGTIAELDGPWVSGLNTVVIAIFNVTMPSGLMVSNTGTAHCPAGVSVAKTVLSDTSELYPGDSVSYAISIANDNPDATATGVTVSDSSTSALQVNSWTCTGSGTAVCPAPSGIGDLAQTITSLPYRGSPSANELVFTVNATVLSSGTVTNTATITPGTGFAAYCISPLGAGYCSDTASVTVRDATASISITKLTNGNEYQAAPGAMVATGSTVTWTYLVENTGTVVVDDVRITDEYTDGLGLSGTLVPVSADNGPLLPGQTREFIAEGTAVPGQYRNTATVTASAIRSNGQPIIGVLVPEASDSSWYTAPTPAPTPTPSDSSGSPTSTSAPTPTPSDSSWSPTPVPSDLASPTTPTPPLSLADTGNEFPSLGILLGVALTLAVGAALVTARRRSIG